MDEYIDIGKFLPGIRGQYLHVIDTPVKEIANVFAGHGFEVFVIEGSRIADEKAFFQEVSGVFGFNENFGYGWASWDESLDDFAYHAPERLAVVWNDIDKTLRADAYLVFQAVCDLHNLSLGMALDPVETPSRSARPKQMELILIGESLGFRSEL